MPATHFLIGLICGSAISLALAVLWRRWLYYAPIFIGLCGFWAQVPDLIGAHGPTSALWRNVFFFHAAIEKSLRGHEFLAFGASLALLNAIILLYVAVIVFYLRPKCRASGRVVASESETSTTHDSH